VWPGIHAPLTAAPFIGTALLLIDAMPAIEERAAAQISSIPSAVTDTE
jgi:hypothetical protein